MAATWFMSESGDIRPTPENLRAVQIWLNHLDDLSEAQPQAVLDATEDALPLLTHWTISDACAWTLALRAKAFRFLDRLPDVLDAAESGLASLRGDEHVAAHLHLEAGMALNQFGRQPEAAEHLQAADRVFEIAGDESGRAWALVSLGEAWAGSGNLADPEAVLKLSIDLADRSGDGRAARRGWKQLAVLHRHLGEPAAALDAIWRALDGDMSDHTRANYLLELGHLKAWAGDYASADDAYQDASASYAEHGDVLGQANVERALATNALILGRHTQGLARLDRAAGLYRTIGSTTGLGYVLRERAVVRVNNGDHTGALSDAEEGVVRFRNSPDKIGLASMLRAAARVCNVTGDRAGADAALKEAHALTADGNNPLGEAGLLSLQAEIGEPASLRLAAGMESARLYRLMGIPTGEAFALSHVARAHTDLGDLDSALATIFTATEALRAARSQVTDPGRRGDHDFALGDVTTNLLNTADRLDGAGTLAMADLIVDEAPLGLRNALNEGQPDPRTRRFVSRITAMRPPIGETPTSRRHLLQQLGATLAFVKSGDDPIWTTFEELIATHPRDALVAYGAPTRHGHLPIAWQLPGGHLQVDLVELDATAVEQIDSLGYAFNTDRTSVLWDSHNRSWQTHLSRVVLPSPLRRWLIHETSPSLVVLFPPVLAHLPIEALLVDGEPVGVRAAVARLAVPTRTTVRATLDHTVAYLDPALTWTPERLAIPGFTTDPTRLRAELGPAKLLFVACHGESAVRVDGALVASDGARVADAIDLLSQPLTGSIIVLEACFAGRYMGHRAGEQLNLATVCLVSGASAAVAGLFALPADDACTGTITADLLRELADGTPAPEAARRARHAYWSTRPERLSVPGRPELSMPGDAPWAWAGLCAYTR